MTISRAAFAAIAEFVASLPEYVPGPEVMDPYDPVTLRWMDNGFGVVLYFDNDGNVINRDRDVAAHLADRVRARLIEHYRPKPREVVGWVYYSIDAVHPDQPHTFYREQPHTAGPWVRVRIIEEPEDAAHG